MNVKKVIKLIKEKLGPYEEEDKNNNGLIFGDGKKKIKEIYFCWRLTLEMLENLSLNDSVLIICHEPIIYDIKQSLIPVSNYNLNHNEKKLNLIYSSKINIARFHLSLDSSPYGTKSTLITRLDLVEKKKFDYFSICELKQSLKTKDFVKKIKNTLEVPFVKVVGNINKDLKKILVVPGGGAKKEFISFALNKGCDAILSGDSYSESEYFAYENKLLIIDPGHQFLEIPGIENFANMIKRDMLNKKIKVGFINNKQIYNFY